MTADQIADSVRRAVAFVASSRARWVVIDYTDQEGVRSERTIIPTALRFGSSPGHPEPQWLLDAADVAQGEERTFALAGSTPGGPTNPETPPMPEPQQQYERIYSAQETVGRTIEALILLDRGPGIRFTDGTYYYVEFNERYDSRYQEENERLTEDQMVTLGIMDAAELKARRDKEQAAHESYRATMQRMEYQRLKAIYEKPSPAANEGDPADV